MAGPWGSMRRNFLTRHTSCVGLGIKKKDAPLKPDLCQPVMRATKRSPFTKGDPTPGEHCACFPPVFQTQALSHHPAWQEYMTQHMFSCLKLKMSIGRPARLAETKEFFFAQDWSSRSDGVPCVSGDSGAGARFPCLAECWGDVPKIFICLLLHFTGCFSPQNIWTKCQKEICWERWTVCSSGGFCRWNRMLSYTYLYLRTRVGVFC